MFYAFLLGAVLVGVAVVAFFMWDNYKSGSAAAAQPAVHVTIKRPDHHIDHRMTDHHPAHRRQ